MFLILSLFPAIAMMAEGDEDFWGNTIEDGDRVRCVDDNHIKGEYYGDGMIRLDSGEYMSLDEEDFEIC